ncbi:DUF6221 family protein [Geodermatophilus sp. SYSU D00815]
MDLAEFLLARIAEDELIAVSAAMTEEEYGPLGNFAGSTTDARLAHAARWGTERVRLENAIRRQLVQIHGEPERPCCGSPAERRPVEPCPTLRLLGLGYATHPDYRADWRP